jgi:hypothetical protein
MINRRIFLYGLTLGTGSRAALHDGRWKDGQLSRAEGQ